MMATTVEWIARHERAVVAIALGTIVALAWVLLLFGAGMPMGDMSGDHHAGRETSPARLAGVFAMWTVMMVAMMLPSAAPTILLFAALRRARANVSTMPSTAVFAGGYVLVWSAFSMVATLAHAALEEAAVVSSGTGATTPLLAGLFLVAAGTYQLTPLKDACLRHCRSPIQFLTRHWRAGNAGALRLGAFHGAYCVGCCWALMGLLFVGGVMNLGWVAAVAAFVALEKTALVGTRWGRAASGAGLVVAGAVAIGVTWYR